MVTSFYYSCVLSHIFVKEGIDCSIDIPNRLGNKINASSLSKALFDLVKKEWIPHAPRATLAPLAALQPVAPVLEGDVSLASLSKLITQMEGRMMCPFDLVDERVDILEYSVELLQDDAEDDVDGGDTALET
ncbi:hypothetical protein V6N13_107158 [Hibiscus sabdariffa]